MYSTYVRYSSQPRYHREELAVSSWNSKTCHACLTQDMSILARSLASKSVLPCRLLRCYLSSSSL
jgi:hypothetical protein